MIYIILGGSGVLGRKIALRLAERECLLILCGRSMERLSSAASEIRSKHPAARVQIEPVDVSDDDSVTRFIKKVQAEGEPTRVLINAAAGFYKGPFIDQPIDSIKTLVNTTYCGIVSLITNLIKTVPHTIPLDIINITSVSAATDLNASRSSAMHISTKAALQTFGVVLGRELCNDGIRITGIAPGTFERHSRPGIPEDVIIDCITFLIDLPASTWIESIVLRPGMPNSLDTQ